MREKRTPIFSDTPKMTGGLNLFLKAETPQYARNKASPSKR